MGVHFLALRLIITDSFFHSTLVRIAYFTACIRGVKRWNFTAPKAMITMKEPNNTHNEQYPFPAVMALDEIAIEYLVLVDFSHTGSHRYIRQPIDLIVAEQIYLY